MSVEFERHLRGTNLAENTVKSYLFAVRQFYERYDSVTKRSLKEHKAWLIEQYKPKTVNLRIRAINCYLESIGKSAWALSSVKVQQKAFLENVISEADYTYFKNCLKRDGNLLWYFVIRFLAATGVCKIPSFPIVAPYIAIKTEPMGFSLTEVSSNARSVIVSGICVI